MIPTAEEYRISQCVSIVQDLFDSDLEELMIGFAKLHVDAALEAASKKVKITERKKVIDNTGGYVRIPTIYKRYILNAYPKELIK
jgi:hypothetical protein